MLLFRFPVILSHKFDLFDLRIFIVHKNILSKNTKTWATTGIVRSKEMYQEHKSNWRAIWQVAEAKIQEKITYFLHCGILRVAQIK